MPLSIAARRAALVLVLDLGAHVVDHVEPELREPARDVHPDEHEEVERDEP
jgi:hypothetical protein